jgi:K+-sensing histidine kinase KdpD
VFSTCDTFLSMAENSIEEGTLAASLGGIGLLVISMFLVPLRDFPGAANVAIVLLVGVQIPRVVGGRRGAIVGPLSFDFLFTEPPPSSG